MTTPKLTSTRTDEPADLCRRVVGKPLLEPSDVAPTDPRLEVIGVFNPAVWLNRNKRILVVRVDERPKLPRFARTTRDGRQNHPVAKLTLNNERSQLDIVDVEVEGEYVRDSQGVIPHRPPIEPGPAGPPLLSHISHLRLAHSVGRGWKVNPAPLLYPRDEFSAFGCEDPRVTTIDGQNYLTYSAISRFGSTAWMATIDPDGTVGSRRMLLGPDHKHSVLFPQKINCLYWLLTRPLVRSWIPADGIWVYRSRRLMYWGQPRPVLMPRSEKWDARRVGPGGTPLRIQEGWLLFYYGVDPSDSYHVGAALLKYSEPSKVLARTDHPVLSPTLAWEREGRRADTVFCCGAELDHRKSLIRLYYGAADRYVGVAEISLSTIRSALSPY